MICAILDVTWLLLNLVRRFCWSQQNRLCGQFCCQCLWNSDGVASSRIL